MNLETQRSVHAVERFLKDRTHPVGSLGGELLVPGGVIAEVPLGVSEKGFLPPWAGVGQRASSKEPPESGV